MTHPAHPGKNIRRGFTSFSRWLPDDSAKTSPPESNHPGFPQRRHRYLAAKEAILMGTLSALFLVAAIAAEFTAHFHSLVLILVIPIVAFFSLHLLCAVAAQLAAIAKQGIAHRDIAQGVIILVLFSAYAAFRAVQPIADWFTPVAWGWLAIVAVDLMGRIFNRATNNQPPNPQ